MEISVVVPAHNAARFIEQTLRSIVDQDHSAAQIIVVDDGSDDNTAALTRDWVERFPSIRLISIDVAGGPSAARNLGWRAARSKWIAFVDADDVWHSAHLRFLSDAVRQYPDASVVFSDIAAFSETPMFPALLMNVHAEPPHPQALGEPELGLFSGGIAISQSGAMVRRECLEEVGGYDEARRYAEDLDLWSRLVQSRPFVRVPCATVAYRVHPNQTSVQNSAHMYAAGWEIRCAMRNRSRATAGAEDIRWDKAEHDLLARDLREAWHSGHRAALDAVIDVARQSPAAGALARLWMLRRVALWHPYVRLRRVVHALRE